MRPGMVEVLDIRVEYALELLLLQDEQVIEALTTHTPQKAFADGIRSRSVRRCSENLDVTCFRNPREAQSKLAIVLPNEILRTRSRGGGFPKRYGRSTRRWESVSHRHGSLCASAGR
jgi:hypothetical protein